jgi:hypothetical protein
MALCGIRIDHESFELVLDERSFGGRRLLSDAAVTSLEDFAARYRHIHTRYDAAAALAVGRELYRWLDGDARALEQLREQAPRPFLFEVRGPRSPRKAEWALLRAPFELLADQQGFLADDDRLRFAPVRRLGSPHQAPQLTDHRLGLVFMASAPHGQRELDYEAEESAILAAVRPERIDLVVEESGNAEELGVRLADLDQMQALHLSCHGLNTPKPVLMMESAEGDPEPTDAAGLTDALADRRPGSSSSPPALLKRAEISAPPSQVWTRRVTVARAPARARKWRIRWRPRWSTPALRRCSAGTARSPTGP